MNNFPPVWSRHLLAVGFLALALQLANAQTPTFAAADLVLGQPDFTSNFTSATPSPSDFDDPVAVAIDPTSGKVFVADGGNNRILRFASVASLSNGASAEMVIGQADFTSGSSNRGSFLPDNNTLSVPRGIFIEASGRLWVADSANSRVLMFASAATLDFDDPASLVLGQPDFTSLGESNAANRMAVPEGVWVDASGTLWVGEFRNHRVTRYDNAASKLDGAFADGVLGQTGFDVNVNGSGAAQLFNPYGVTVDSTGTLWVADRANNRVVGYPNAAALPPGSAATRLLGQSVFGATTASLSASGVAAPRSVWVDSSDTLWVLDNGNNRALRFDAVTGPGKPNGAPADAVAGQSNLISGDPGLSSQRLNLGATAFLFVDPARRVWVADVTNNRVVRFSLTSPTTPVDTTRPTLKVRGRKTIETLRKRIVIRGTANDDSSGIAKIEVKTRRGAKVRKIKSGTRWKAVLKVTKPRGRVVLKIRAVDGAGNRSAYSKVRILRR